MQPRQKDQPGEEVAGLHETAAFLLERKTGEKLKIFDTLCSIDNEQQMDSSHKTEAGSETSLAVSTLNILVAIL